MLPSVTPNGVLKLVPNVLFFIADYKWLYMERLMALIKRQLWTLDLSADGDQIPGLNTDGERERRRKREEEKGRSTLKEECLAKGV